MNNNSIASRVIFSLRDAVRPALATAWWITKIMFPVTLALACLDYVGVIGWISVQCAPLFELLGLPGESGLVFITTALSNLYASIAVVATLGFDYRSVTILAVMGLICHNLIIESAIQHKTGASAWKMTGLRICTALVAAVLLNWLLPEQMSGRLFLPVADTAPGSWSEVFSGWLGTVVPLTLKMVAIILGLNITQSLLREFRVMNLLAVPLRPFMALFGLPRSTSFLWIICNTLGITYGSAALVDEIRRGEVTVADSKLLNTHVAISHSLLEDTVLCTSIGLAVPWLLIPRLVLALVAVWGTRAVESLRKQIRSTDMQHSAAQ